MGLYEKFQLPRRLSREAMPKDTEIESTAHTVFLRKWKNEQ